MAPICRLTCLGSSQKIFSWVFLREIWKFVSMENVLCLSDISPVLQNPFFLHMVESLDNHSLFFGGGSILFSLVFRGKLQNWALFCRFLRWNSSTLFVCSSDPFFIKETKSCWFSLRKFFGCALKRKLSKLQAFLDLYASIFERPKWTYFSNRSGLFLLGRSRFCWRLLIQMMEPKFDLDCRIWTLFEMMFHNSYAGEIGHPVPIVFRVYLMDQISAFDSRKNWFYKC